jgi:predicted transcriptional regulator
MHLISIYPQYVSAILAGQKTVECRKSALGLSKGDLLQLYATAPVMAVLGQARVADVHRGTPEELWQQFQHRTGVREADYFGYYRGKKEAVLLRLTEVRRHPQPMTLAELRAADGRFSPPQTARRLAPALQALFS